MSQELYYEAIQTALRIDEPVEIANLFMKIVRSLLAVDDRDYASALLPGTLKQIQELPESQERNYLLRLFLRLQCDMNLLDQAQNTLFLIDSQSEHHAVALRDIAVAEARNGLFVEALKMAEELEDLDDYEAVLEMIGQKQVALHQLGEVVQTAARIEAGELRAKLLRALAQEQWKLGLAEESLQTLRSAMAMIRGISDVVVRNRVLSQTAIAFTEIHRVFDALTAAKEMNDPPRQIETLCTIIVSLQRGGNFIGGKSAANEAAATARRIDDPFHRGRGLWQVGAALHRIGDTEEAKAVFREALASIKTIRNSYSQAQSMTEFAAELAKIELPETARRVFRLAWMLAETIESDSLQLRCLGEIVRAQTAARLLDDVDKTIEKMENVVEDAQAELPRGELPSGDFERELAVAYGLAGNAFQRSDQTEWHENGAKYLEKSLETARKIFDPLNRATALYLLAELQSPG